MRSCLSFYYLFGLSITIYGYFSHVCIWRLVSITKHLGPVRPKGGPWFKKDGEIKVIYKITLIPKPSQLSFLCTVHHSPSLLLILHPLSSSLPFDFPSLNPSISLITLNVLCPFASLRPFVSVTLLRSVVSKTWPSLSIFLIFVLVWRVLVSIPLSESLCFLHFVAWKHYETLFVFVSLILQNPPLFPWMFDLVVF